MRKRVRCWMRRRGWVRRRLNLRAWSRKSCKQCARIEYTVRNRNGRGASNIMRCKMNMKTWILAAAVAMTVGGFGGVSLGETVLDEGLGGNGPKPAPTDEVKPAAPAAPVVAPDAKPPEAPKL